MSRCVLLEFLKTEAADKEVPDTEHSFITLDDLERFGGRTLLLT